MSEGPGINNFMDSIMNEGRIFGVMVGIVIHNDSANHADQPGPGRVKVKIPLMGMQESNWARMASWMAGKGRGAFCLPEVEDEVLVAFENGDVNRPYVIGSLWNGKDVPPETNKDGKNNIRLFKSRSGHVLQFADTQGEESITLTSAKGHVIRLDDKGGAEQIRITDKSGKNRIILDTKANKVTVSSGAELEITAGGKLSLSAKSIEMKSASGTLIESKAGMDIKAAASMKLKGAAIDLN
ncbi:phage baseplate assembly protein V [Paenibacillus piscarius]|uniref:phage baseplate assembly protein V n=1 Tax=Paenibacillus piscarius TaxID=1089681 RepID=UPI001EE8C555|nr:phage baseplate assembly protein V [Paenibacillus piscarius]